MINKEINKFIEQTYRLKTMVRYNNTPRIKSESVAEHMYFVTLTVYKLYEYYDFDLPTALKMALFHDIPEIYLSDIPSNTKTMFPELREINKKNLKKAIDFIDPTMAPFIEAYELQETVEAKIVKLADLLSVVQYTSLESKLGNAYMQSINKEARATINDLYKKLEPVNTELN